MCSTPISTWYARVTRKECASQYRITACFYIYELSYMLALIRARIYLYELAHTCSHFHTYYISEPSSLNALTSARSRSLIPTRLTSAISHTCSFLQSHKIEKLVTSITVSQSEEIAALNLAFKELQTEVMYARACARAHVMSACACARAHVMYAYAFACIPVNIRVS
jgi:hypothetical protein